MGRITEPWPWRYSRPLRSRKELRTRTETPTRERQKTTVRSSGECGSGRDIPTFLKFGRLQWQWQRICQRLFRTSQAGLLRCLGSQ